MVLLQSKTLPIGQWKAPEFDLPGVDGQNYSLDSFTSEKGLVVIFTCNHCPYARAAWPLTILLSEQYPDIDFVAISVNDVSAHPEDSFDKMKEFAASNDVPFPYLYDESQQSAKDYQAQCTPDIYVFDAERTLYYHGRIDDNWQEPDNVESEDLKDALQALVSSQEPPREQFPSMGCSIKWKE